METDPSCRLLPSSSSAPRLHPWQPSVEVDKKKNPVVFLFLETHKHTHPNKNKTTRSPHQLSPFSDLKEHLLIGKRALFKNTTDATYTKHTRTDPVCTKTLGCINNDEQHFKKKEDTMQKHEEERRERSFVESPNSRHGCLLDCICLLFIIMYFLCEELGLKY